MSGAHRGSIEGEETAPLEDSIDDGLGEVGHERAGPFEHPHEVGLLKEEIKSVVARIRGQLAQGENEGWRKKATAALNFVLEKQHVLARYEKKLKWDLRESGKLKKVLREVTSDEIEEIRELIDKGDHGEALHLLTDIVEDSLL